MGKAAQHTEMYHAALYGSPSHLEEIKGMVARGEDVNQRNHDNTGVAPLHIASARARMDVMKFLIESGADVNITSHILGETPLHWAARWKQPEAIRLLAKNGADVNAKDKWAHSVLDHAEYKVFHEEEFKSRYQETVELLVLHLGAVSSRPF